MYLCAGDCKPSEVKAFTADYLEKVMEPCDWLALWSTEVFDVLVEVRQTVISNFKVQSKLETVPFYVQTDCSILD